jgi:F0F1-type ATP synthase membrane subunit b/b'
LEGALGDPKERSNGFVTWLVRARVWTFLWFWLLAGVVILGLWFLVNSAIADWVLDNAIEAMTEQLFAVVLTTVVGSTGLSAVATNIVASIEHAKSEIAYLRKELTRAHADTQERLEDSKASFDAAISSSGATLSARLDSGISQVSSGLESIRKSILPVAAANGEILRRLLETDLPGKLLDAEQENSKLTAHLNGLRAEIQEVRKSLEAAATENAELNRMLEWTDRIFAKLESVAEEVRKAREDIRRKPS